MNRTNRKMMGALVALLVSVGLGVFVSGRVATSHVGEVQATTSSVATSNSSQKTKKNEPIAAPDFSFTDEQGTTLNLASFQDKPTVLVFWASWCPYCKAELDGIEQIYDEFADKVNFVALDCISSNGETEEAGRATKEEHGWSFPIYFDSDIEGQASYGVRSMPATAIIDTDGNISLTQLGLLEHESLASLLRGMGA